MPCFTARNCLDLDWAFYGLRAVVCRIGITKHSGHYRSFLYGGFRATTSDPTRRYLADDEVPAVESSVLEIQSDAFIILQLLRSRCS